MRSANIDSKVELRKTINVSNDVVHITYRIRPTVERAERIQLVERLPQSVPASAITDETDGGQWEVCDDTKLVFVGRVTDSEPIRTTLRIESATLNPADCVSAVRLLPDDATTPPATDPRTDGDGPPVATGNGDAGGAAPALGLLSTEANVSAVARATFRAIDHGLSVFIAADHDDDTLSRIGGQLGATVVEVDADEWTDDEIATRLAHMAQQRSHPGILYHGDRRDRIDFEESLAAFAERQGSVTAPVVDADGTSVLVGIPAYNEGDTVGDVVAEASDYADEVLVVDDGSDDATAARAREASATVVEHDRNRGYGHTLKTIFAEAADRDADLLVTLDADGQHDPADIERLVESHREVDAGIVIGSRFGDAATDIPTYRRAGLWAITLLTNASIGGLDDRIRDPQSGLRAYDSAVVDALADNLTAIDDRMSASIDILSIAYDHGFSTAEVPVTISYDVENASTRNPVRHGMNLVNKIRKTLQRNRPVAVLGVPGILLVLSGVGVTHWAVSDYVTQGTVSLELTLLSALLILTGLLSSVLSIVRHSLNTHVGSASLAKRN